MASVPKASASTSPKNNYDFIRRGDKTYNQPGSLTFIGIRPLVPFIQYGILAKGWGSSVLNAIGVDTLPAGLPNTGTALDVLGLSPYRLVLFGMSLGSTIKQIYWQNVTSQEQFTPAMAGFVTGFNGFFDTVSTLLFTTSFASASLSSGAQFPQTPLIVGSALYVLGLALEIVPETQRKLFKDKPENKGKIYTGGLWKYSRHINYAGYTIWRTGFSIAGGGWIWGAITGAFLSYDFFTRAIPSIESYCSQKYGVQWKEYERQTPYQYLPFVY